MRIALLSFFLVLFVETGLPAVSPPSRPDTTARAHKKSTLMRKIKGALAVAVVICFGPVAYLGVRLLTHDEEVRRKAKQALIAWLVIVGVLAVVLMVAYTTTPGPH